MQFNRYTIIDTVHTLDATLSPFAYGSVALRLRQHD